MKLVHTQTQSCLVNAQLHTSQGFADKNIEGVDIQGWAMKRENFKT